MTKNIPTHKFNKHFKDQFNGKYNKCQTYLKYVFKFLSALQFSLFIELMSLATYVAIGKIGVLATELKDSLVVH